MFFYNCLIQNYFSRVLGKNLYLRNFSFVQGLLILCFKAAAVAQHTRDCSLLVFTNIGGNAFNLYQAETENMMKGKPPSAYISEQCTSLNCGRWLVLYTCTWFFWEVLYNFWTGMAVGLPFITHSGFGGKFGLVCHLDFVTHVASQGLMTCLQMGCYLLQSCRIKLIVF